MVLSTVLANDAVTNNKQVLLYSLPLAHMHNEIYSSCPVCLPVCMCVCVCVCLLSLFCLLALLGVQRGVAVATAWEM